MVLDAAAKAAKRKEIAERRAKNDLARELMPIAYKQSNLLASSSGVAVEDIVGQAMLGIAEAMLKGNAEQPGFYRRNKLYARGYCLNYLRDKSRDVRLPRNLTLAYLAEQKALRENAAYRLLSNAEKAEYLGLSLDVLLEARSAISMYSTSLDFWDGCYDKDSVDTELGTASDNVLQVISAGVKVVAASGKISEDAVERQFYESLRMVLDNAKA
jgi:hypothetical protein